MKKWSSQWTQFMQLRKEAWKKCRTSTGFEPVTSRLPVRCSTNWAMKPLTLGAGHIVHKKFNSCLYVNYRFNWPRVICDYVLIWIYKACTMAKQRLVFLRSLSFPGFLCHPVDTAWEGSEGPSHCPRIVENMILLSLIYSFFLDYWLDMSHLILASCSRHLLFASLKLAIWESVLPP